MSPTRQLADSVRAYCEQVCDQQPKSATVRIQYVDDTFEERTVNLAATLDGPRLADADYELLDVINSLDAGQWLTANEIAERVGSTPHSRFRDRLSRLTRLELIESDRRFGYGPKQKSEKSKKVSGAK